MQEAETPDGGVEGVGRATGEMAWGWSTQPEMRVSLWRLREQLKLRNKKGCLVKETPR